MSNRNVRQRVLKEARNWVGTPYLHQASTVQKGCDCLGLVRGVWRKLYGQKPEIIPNYSSDWGEAGQEETLLIAARKWFNEVDLADARAGDLVVFRWKNQSVAKHLGILSGHSNFIHSYERAGVVETTLGSHWRARIVAAFAFPNSVQK